MASESAESEVYIRKLFSGVLEKSFKGTYRGVKSLNETGSEKHVVELVNKEDKEVFRHIKSETNKRKCWSSITDPELDKTRYPEQLDTSIWCLKSAEQDVAGLPDEDSPCEVTITKLKFFNIPKKWKMAVQTIAIITNLSSDE